ncbi:GNAT family N-acetyltransferase [Saccharibacillus sp. CPCC 101409]|uniref:GNAT family N-acetyltransferase n=1 Tax=Saccharibacillus sp. CPCC 101409 TaxID=3058041 RepID=UPI0026716069|nr:GNAT family N-acetyltransferase [Saccharibacillus sp. CPCC 101409]MDO3411351.1 GNAT family N-acetyltransferase [Saccharibacillus sp. CPCC 101409]
MDIGKVEIRRAKGGDRKTFEKLWQLYLYDFSEFTDMDVRPDGTYPQFPEFELYWKKWGGDAAYFILAEGRIAGFAMVHEFWDNEAAYLSQFFVMRKYRRRGVGSKAARLVFETKTGRWGLHQLANNLPAQRFWDRIIFDLTGTLPLIEKMEEGRRFQLFEMK